MKKIFSKSALLTLLTVGLVSLFAVGCGNSDNFVATGTVNTANTGNLLFNITEAAAQTTDEVPNGTVSLRFDFWNSTSPTSANLVFTETRAFTGPNQEYLFENVPNTVVFVTVTAFGANGQPLVILSGTTTVAVGATTAVDLTGSTNPTFDALTVTPAPALILTPGTPTVQTTATGTFTANVLAQGSTTVAVDLTGASGLNCTFTEFAGNPTATANITTTGQVNLVTDLQNSTLTCEYTAFGTTRSASTLVRTCDFQGNVAAGPTSFNTNTPFNFNGWYFVEFCDSDGGSTCFNPGNSQINEGANTVYSLASGQTDVVVNPTDGTFTTSVNTTGDVQIRCTWTDPRTQNADGSGGTGSAFSTIFTFTNNGAI